MDGGLWVQLMNGQSQSKSGEGKGRVVIMFMWQLSLIMGLAAVPPMGRCFPENALFPAAEKQKQQPWEEVLMERLFDGYNDLVLPVENATQPVNVWFGLSLVQLLQIDEQNQV